MTECGKINAGARMLSMDGRAGAIVVTGTDKIRSGYGNGDCVLLDFRHRVFALSDSTERHSVSSRELLRRLYEHLEEKGMPVGVDSWRSAVNSVFSFQSYRHKATFSCVALEGHGASAELTALNGGDSVIMVINMTTGSVEYMSRPDMYFAGRSREIAHASRIVLEKAEYRVVLCSDGLSDIAKLSGRELLEMVMDDPRCRVSALPERFRNLINSIGVPGNVEYDDTGVIVLDPWACLEKKECAVIMGGSGPHEESRYQSDPRRLAEWDRWMTADELETNCEIMRDCGISIMH